MKSSISILLVFLSVCTQPLSYADNQLNINSNKVIRLATTTSTDNSGLLTFLIPKFEEKTGYRVHVIAVGTGKALRMGRDGDVDVLLVHAPDAEKNFIKAGYGEQRYPVMYNDFILVGPATNPANIEIKHSITESFQAIAEHNSMFISRGDNSGTHTKELALWQQSNIEAEGNWYREAGQGMGKVLQIAAELEAYTLTDRGTWLAYQGKLALNILNQGDPQLYNPYHIIAVNPERFSYINHAGANALISWITSIDGQSLIASFTINDTLLFKPSANAKQLAARLTKQTNIEH